MSFLRVPVFKYKGLFVCFCIMTLLAANHLFGQSSLKNVRWQGWQFLLGEWVGEGGGEPGQGIGSFSFKEDLQGTVIVRKNYSDYPATKDRPAFSHDDLMIINQETGKQTTAMYFDNEGHVIHYTVEFSKDSNSVIFISGINTNAPRFRLTYEKKAEGQIKIKFAIAPPGKPEEFKQYIEASARRK